MLLYIVKSELSDFEGDELTCDFMYEKVWICCRHVFLKDQNDGTHKIQVRESDGHEWCATISDAVASRISQDLGGPAIS